MRAAVFHTVPEVLAIEDVPVPPIGPDDILVRVKAHTVQPFDTRVREGWVPTTAEVKLPLITGNEFAGTVAALGSDVQGFAIGDRVAGRHTFGCAAEYLAVPAADVAQLPESLSFPEGAYLGGTGQTAHMAIEFLGVHRGDVLLVHGGAGGVGSIAVQLGAHAGARVLATGSDRNQEYLEKLGAHPLVCGDGLKERIEAAAPEGVSVILDCAGGEALDVSIALGTDKRRIATLGDHRRCKELGVQWPSGLRNGSRLAKLIALADSGNVRVHIRRTYPLAEIAEAHREVESGHGQGKVAVLID